MQFLTIFFRDTINDGIATLKKKVKTYYNRPTLHHKKHNFSI